MEPNHQTPNRLDPPPALRRPHIDIASGIAGRPQVGAMKVADAQKWAETWLTDNTKTLQSILLDTIRKSVGARMVPNWEAMLSTLNRTACQEVIDTAGSTDLLLEDMLTVHNMGIKLATMCEASGLSRASCSEESN